MTTVAYKDGEMSADRGVVVGNSFAPCQITKVFCIETPDGVRALIGYAGSVSTGQQLVRWACEGFKSGEFPTLNQSDGFVTSLLVAREDGRILEYEEEVPMLLEGSIASIGSGGGFAAASMLSGSSSAEAVSIASSLDLYTASGGVDTVSFYDDPINRK